MIRTLIIGLLLSGAVHAADAPLSEHNPFAEHHVLLQVSTADASRHGLTLDISNNLPKHYGGQDMIDIQVVAFGPGVAMLTEESPHAERIASLQEHGVRFYVCGNTLDTLERKSGQRPRVLPGVVTVQTGVAFMLDEARRGYTLVQP